MPDFITPERRARGAGPGLSFLLGAKLFNGQPLAMEQALAARVQDAVHRGAFDAQISLGPMSSKFVGTKAGSSGYRVTDDGVAIVPVAGMLIDRGEFLGDIGGWLTTYEGISEQCRRIAKDDAIKAVLLDIDSGGGMVAGLLDVCADLARLRAKKRLYAIAANSACSAAYAIACVADEVFVTTSAAAGSIGTIMVHASYQRALDEGGIDTTIIYEGDHKPDGNPYQQLSHGARSEFGASIAQANAMFVAHVARERDMGEDAVRALQARVLWGDKAVAAGLADGVKGFDGVLEHIKAAIAKGGRPRGKAAESTSASRTQPTSTGDPGMPGNHASGETPDLQALITAGLAQLAAKPAAPAQPAPVAPVAAAPVAAPAAPAQAGVDAEARIFAILDCDEAKDRPALARTLARNGKLSVDEAKAILAASAVEKPAAATVGDALAARMANAGNRPGVKPDAPVADAKKQSFAEFCAATANKKG